MVFIPSGKWKVASFAIRRLIDPNGTNDFRLRHYDASRIGYQRLPVELGDNEEDENADNNRIRSNLNRNCNASAAYPIQEKLGQIKSGTAVNVLNMFHFRSLLI